MFRLSPWGLGRGSRGSPFGLMPTLPRQVAYVRMDQVVKRDICGQLRYGT